MKKPIIVLAPLAGVTDRAFRFLCKRYGADETTTEMVSSNGIFYRDPKSAELMDISHDSGVTGIQLFGSNPDIMAAAAEVAQKNVPAFIDINMGCPMPKIVNNGDGSALMRDIKKAEAVIKAVVLSCNAPVSVKFRSGYDENHINAVEFAKMCEASGAYSVCVHARTRKQLYSGKADYNVIAAVKNAVNIRVIGNGDVFKPEDAKKMLEKTGCDGVAVARGALGNPFIFGQIKSYLSSGTYDEISADSRLSVAAEQAVLMCEYKPERIAVPEMRKHMAWYMKGLPDCAGYKNRIFNAKTIDETLQIINQYLQIHMPCGNCEKGEDRG